MQGSRLSSRRRGADEFSAKIPALHEGRGLSSRAAPCIASCKPCSTDAARFCIAGQTQLFDGTPPEPQFTVQSLGFREGNQLKLLGQSLFDLDEDGRAALRAKSLGFVFQSFQLLPNLTALENVMLPLELAGRPAQALAIQMLEQVGLSQRLHHYPSTLSGGEQQRVSLARAFVQRPDLLFADEPTGSLDHATGARVIEMLFSLYASLGTTLVLVTHDPQLAARCDRQLVLQGGRLV